MAAAAAELQLAAMADRVAAMAELVQLGKVTMVVLAHLMQSPTV